MNHEVPIPPLFKVYLDMGAKVCSEPAIDREFGVIDFLIVLDVENLDERTAKRMFGNSSWERWQRAGARHPSAPQSQAKTSPLSRLAVRLDLAPHSGHEMANDG